MIVDISEMAGAEEIEADICVIGSGAAGLSFAREFIDHQWRVAIIAGGDRDFNPEWQELYRGSSVGRPFRNTEDSRLRQFGGTTNHWAGGCRPLEPIDFERGWPFEFEDLVPFYQRAHELCQLGPFDYRTSFWESQTRQDTALLDSSRIEIIFFQYSPPTVFGEVYEENFARSSNVSVYLNVSALELETHENGAQVKNVKCTTLDQKIINVSALYIVVACGGLENPRLLLNSNRHRPDGIGNEAGLVGRYFMEHPHQTGSRVVLSNPFLPSPLIDRLPTKVPRLGVSSDQPLEIRACLALPAAVLRREGINNVRYRLEQSYREPHERRVEKAKISGRRLLTSFAEFQRRNRISEYLGTFVENADALAADSLGIRQRAYPMANMFDVVTWIEQTPNKYSQVRLGQRLDRFGQREIMVDWQWSEQDKRTLVRSQELFARAVDASGIGRLIVDLDNDALSLGKNIGQGSHHMGTTRMHDDPSKGVTNQHGRVHSVENLYIAGSSLFPTGGHANPTLTIVALALKLADHLKQQHL